MYFISKILWHSHVCIWNRNGTGRKIAFESDILEMANVSVCQCINTYAVLHVETQLTPHYSQQSWSQILITLHWRHNGRDAAQITSLTFVYSTVYSGADERKHQSSASLAFVRGIERWPVNSPQKWPVTRKMFPFDDVIMEAHIPCAFNYHHAIYESTRDSQSPLYKLTIRADLVNKSSVLQVKVIKCNEYWVAMSYIYIRTPILACYDS